MLSEYAMKAAHELWDRHIGYDGPHHMESDAVTIDRAFAPLLAERERLKVLMQLALDHEEGCVDRDRGYSCDCEWQQKFRAALEEKA